MRQIALCISNINCNSLIVLLHISVALYFTGDLPQDTQIGNVTVCANDGSMCPSQYAKTIRVRNCGLDNYVFELQHTDSSSEAYCIGL